VKLIHCNAYSSFVCHWNVLVNTGPRLAGPCCPNFHLCPYFIYILFYIIKTLCGMLSPLQVPLTGVFKRGIKVLKMGGV
jgi:hypothetical protein